MNHLNRFNLLIVILISSIPGFSQSVTGTTVIQNTSANSFDIKVTQTASKPVNTWLEYGDGGFSTKGITTRILGKQFYPALVAAAPLYDTGKDFSQVTVLNTAIITGYNTGVLNQSANKLPVLPLDKWIYVTQNVSDIALNDPMIFALTYKILDAAPIQGFNIKNKYELLFYYNDTRSFNDINAVNKIPGINVDNIRVFEKEEIGFSMPSGMESIDSRISGFKKCISFKLTQLQLDGERNIFINTKAFGDLEIGKSCSIYAIFVETKPDGSKRKIDDFFIDRIPFALAHDPNYIVQTPFCIKNPKKIKEFTYKVHFQNIGAGDADQVRVEVMLPEGMDVKTLKIQSCNFACVDAKSFFSTSEINSKKLIFLFNPEQIPRGRLLHGTLLKGNYVDNPSVNPLTTGEIHFTLNATTQVQDSLEAYADIYFRNKADGSWNEVVKTRVVKSFYKDCCDCSVCVCPPIPVPSICYKILGLCWWWWLIILATIIIILWLLKRQRNSNNVAV